MSLHLSAEYVLQPSASVVQAQAVMDQHAKSFSWAARFLAKSARHDAAQLYAFARLADDLADEEQLGSFVQRMSQLALLRSDVLQSSDVVHRDSAHAGKSTSQACLVGRMLHAHGVDARVVASFMDSLSQDAQPRRIGTPEELLLFAYGVAGTVGQMMCPILGAPASAQHFAMALGIAMQLTNIARDVIEDAQRGRCYLPKSWGIDMDGFEVPPSKVQAESIFAAVQRIVALADDFYAFAHGGMAHIPADNRRAINIAAALYRGIGLKIVKEGQTRYWQGRVSLGRAEKIWIIVKALAGVGPAYGQPLRDVLANDLHHLAGWPGFPQQSARPA